MLLWQCRTAKDQCVTLQVHSACCLLFHMYSSQGFGIQNSQAIKREKAVVLVLIDSPAH